MSRRSIRIATLATAGLALFYVAVVGGIGGFDHLPGQARDDWLWLVLILAGFGTQIGLYAELRHRRRLAPEVQAAAGAGGVRRPWAWRPAAPTTWPTWLRSSESRAPRSS